MEILLAVICSLIVGVIAGYLFGKRGVRRAEQRCSALQDDMAALQREITALQVERGALQSDNRHLTELLEAEKARAKEEDKRRREEFMQQLEIVKGQLCSETNRSNRESISEILKPYQEQLEALKKQSVDNRATLETHIKTLVETGGKLSNEADRLARALSSDVRMQGNLGEKLLEDLLAGSGLVEGKQYLLQRAIRQADGASQRNEDTGKKMKPDAMIFYPATKSVLYIDSKFKLPTDLDDNMEPAREQEVLKEFSARLRKEVQSLSNRRYQDHKYEEYISLPYVIMFVPSDKALMAVTAYDKTLWLDAFNSKVFIASERHLLMLIEMVNVVWVQQQRLENQDKIVAQASTILDRVTDFIGYFDEIGTALNDAVDAFEKTKKKGIGAGQTISVAVRDMLKLGAKAQTTKQKKLDAQLVDAGLDSSES
ncbi:MAG: DNA recombination protein RmuC [Alistipes sp.]|nr:DNA recombination protein RmuC [Alistipes sp.]